MKVGDAKLLLQSAWPAIVEECRAVLGGELHYQAVIYHCLRNAGCPRGQMGMNVKQFIEKPVTELFQKWEVSTNPAFSGGFEPIPDIVLFTPDIGGNWQRRNYENTLRHMRCAIEVKASERAKRRLTTGEIRSDIAKLAAHRDEALHLGGAMWPVMMVIDVATDPNEQMRESTITECAGYAVGENVAWLYASQTRSECLLG